MTPREVLQNLAQTAYKDLLESIDGVTEEQAWGIIQLQPGEYLHTEGSILSQVLHASGVKFLYGSCAFRNLDVRWSDVVARMEGFWPSWSAAKEYLQESHDYWMASWAAEEDFERAVKNFRMVDKPALEIIGTMIRHDSYHAGEIVVQRVTVVPSAVPPPAEGDRWREFCGQLPSW